MTGIRNIIYIRNVGESININILNYVRYKLNKTIWVCEEYVVWRLVNDYCRKCKYETQRDLEKSYKFQIF